MKYIKTAEVDSTRDIVSDMKNALKAIFLISTGRPSSGPELALKPPGTVKPAVKVTVAISAATIKCILDVRAVHGEQMKRRVSFSIFLVNEAVKQRIIEQHFYRTRLVTLHGNVKNISPAIVNHLVAIRALQNQFQHCVCVPVTRCNMKSSLPLFVPIIRYRRIMLEQHPCNHSMVKMRRKVKGTPPIFVN
nr:hypothetical protein Iba_chr05bCG8750 [Ipomoea batatas]